MPVALVAVLRPPLYLVAAALAGESILFFPFSIGAGVLQHGCLFFLRHIWIKTDTGASRNTQCSRFLKHAVLRSAVVRMLPHEATEHFIFTMICTTKPRHCYAVFRTLSISLSFREKYEHSDRSLGLYCSNKQNSGPWSVEISTLTLRWGGAKPILS